MIDKLEVTPGPGTVIRYGAIVAWADQRASAALVSFLAQSARNLASSIRGGRQVADHIATVLGDRDPEPNVGFAIVGPSDHGWATLLHGPAQLWDGSRWLAPAPSPGWLQAIVTPQPAVTVGAAGSPAPSLEPDTMWDLESGVVPGAGFVLVPTPRPGVQPVWPVDEAPGAIAVDTVVAAASPVEDPTGVLPEIGREAPALETPGDETAVIAVTAGVARAAAAEALGTDVPRTAAKDASGQDDTVVLPPTVVDQSDRERRAAAAAADPLPPGAVDLRSVGAPAGVPLPIGDFPDPQLPGAAVVAGVRCRSGHLNRPSMTVCGRCGADLPARQAETVSGTRPALGALVTDDGTVYRLDHGYLAGTDPGRDPTVSGGLARPLLVSGTNVAPSHAEVRLNGWDVVLLDRGSAGGTYVFEPTAEGWDRLKPFEPRILAPGAHVAFGQRVVTYATPWV